MITGKEHLVWLFVKKAYDERQIYSEPMGEGKQFVMTPYDEI